MKKFRVICISLVLLLIFSFGQNLKSIIEKDRARRFLINQLYSSLYTISFNLDGIILNLESNITDDAVNQDSIEMLSVYFAKLDTIITQHRFYFDELYHPGILSFDYISYTLGSGSGETNGIRYNGILKDNAISENEVRYLIILRDDIKLIVNDMVSAENPPQENPDISITRLNAILGNFYDKWSSIHEEDSPYLLLRDEER